MQGYLSEKYAQSLSELGTPLFLEESQGWIIKRSINHYYDGMGCYPLFCCQDWSKIPLDITQIKSEIISLALVADPFGNYRENDLRKTFSDVCFAYKEHFVIDLKKDKKDFVIEHHQRNAKKALKLLQIQSNQEGESYLDNWNRLYNNLIEKHNIKGISKFSPKSFEKQLQVSGLQVFSAIYGSETIGILLWYIQNDIAYYHLGAYSELGYIYKASFALFWYAIDYFCAKGLNWLNLGAGAGFKNDQTDGLTRFKKGWSTETKTAYFCGKIFDLYKYNELIKFHDLKNTAYFPAYRFGDFS
jgi:hypothetical protein